MGVLEIALSYGMKLTIREFTSPRGLGTVYFVEDEQGPIETFMSREEAEDALKGVRKPAERLVY